MPVGRFRDEEGSVQVDYGTGTTIPIPRSKYEARGYKADFDKLPSESGRLGRRAKEGTLCPEALKAVSVNPGRDSLI